MENKKLTLYDKNKIIERASSMLKYYDKSEYKKEVIKASHLLMDKVRYCDEDNITLEPDFIEEILFVLNEDGTKSIVKDVYHLLRSINADLINVSFDNVHVSGYYFSGFKNVEINIQKIPNFDISNTFLTGVKVNGTLDGANIMHTDFAGYIGNLVLNPQLVQNKDLYFTNVDGITINGSFDGVNVRYMQTKGFKGEIIINPQKVKDRDLSSVDLDGIKLVGEYDEKTGTYSDPCFENCRINRTNFKGCIGNVTIPLDKICLDAVLCNFTGVKLTGKILNNAGLGLMLSYYEDENGKKIFLEDNKDNSEEIDIEEKMYTHKTRTRKPNLINRFFSKNKK